MGDCGGSQQLSYCEWGVVNKKYSSTIHKCFVIF